MSGEEGGETGVLLPELGDEITEGWSHITASVGQRYLTVAQEPVDVVIFKVGARLPLPVLQLAGEVDQLAGDLDPVVDEAGQLVGLAGVLRPPDWAGSQLGHEHVGPLIFAGEQRQLLAQLEHHVHLGQSLLSPQLQLQLIEEHHQLPL